MTIKEKLEEYDLYDQSIIRHGFMDYIRDYEIIGYLCGGNFDLEVQYLFKGCIKIDYNVNINPEYFSMDDRLLDLDKQDEFDYPRAFIWGVKGADVYPGWTLLESTDELIILKERYKTEFFQVFFKTNAYDLTVTFHDLDIKQLRKIEKQKNAT